MKVKRVLKRIKKFLKDVNDRKLIRKVTRRVGTCGNALNVFGEVDIVYPSNIAIKDNCRLNDKVYLNARSGIYIGNNVTISYGAKIISTGYDIKHWIESGEKRHMEDQPIYIGDHCWIGTGAIILPGVQITGEYVVIGAGAVVTKNIAESKVIVAGSPARIVKRLGDNKNV